MMFEHIPISLPHYFVQTIRQQIVSIYKYIYDGQQGNSFVYKNINHENRNDLVTNFILDSKPLIVPDVQY